jgi:DNA-binding NtrC family response regulator
MHTLLIASKEQSRLVNLSSKLIVDYISDDFGSARALIQTGKPVDVVLIRLPLTGIDPESALAEAQRIAPAVPIILWGAIGRTTDAVRYSQMGAYQFVTDDLTADELQ